ncbi:MAG: ATP-binding protein [Candidatus Eisenbacteria bacterium]
MQREARDDRWSLVERRMEELRAVLPALAELPAPSPENLTDLFLRLAEETELLQRRGIRDQIHHASFQELVEALLRGHDANSILDTLTTYLLRVLCLDEILCLRRSEHPAGWVGYYGSQRARGLERVHLEHLPPEGDRLHPARFRFNESLGTRGANALDDPDACVGLLCMNRDGEWGVDDPSPGAIARRVAGILETLRHREAQERSDRFRRQLLEAMRDGVLAVGADGQILEINAAAAHMLELPDEDSLRGQSIELLRPKAPVLIDHLRAALRAEAAPAPHELALPGAHGPLPINLATSPIQDDTGSFRGLVVNLTDLTAVKEMEEEIRRLDHLAALGRFAAGIAHEIRNPLAGIEAGVQYIARRFNADAPEQDDIRFVTSEVRRLNRIVSDLLDYTRPRPLDPKALEVPRLVQHLAQTVDPLRRPRGVRLDLRGPSDCHCWADAERLEQVLLNLVKNAIEASPAEEVVSLTWEERDDGGLAFAVADRGPGMSEEERARAFEPFFTTKGNGTGLGLYLSHAIAQQHGGRLSLSSRPGGGTIARLELPAGGAERVEENAVVHSDR